MIYYDDKCYKKYVTFKLYLKSLLKKMLPFNKCCIAFRCSLQHGYLAQLEVKKAFWSDGFTLIYNKLKNKQNNKVKT